MTICKQNRDSLFGAVADDNVQLNDADRMIEHWWFELDRKFSTVETDEFVDMPNHFHGIVVIAGVTVGADLRVGPDPEGAHVGAPLPTIVQWFKTMTTNEYIREVKTQGWLPFRGKLWQRDYYEHVIRENESLNRIQQYITDNPSRRAFDRENPVATRPEPETAWRP